MTHRHSMSSCWHIRHQRVKKITQEATTTFFYDDWNLIEERVAYTNGTSSTIRYYWGKDISGTLQGAGGVGGLLYLTVSNSSTPNSPTHQLYIPFYDNNGNVTRYLDANGNTVARYTYDAFGNTISQTGPLADAFAFRFSTKYFDSESGLYYYGYRYYHPALMRWLTTDPLEEDGGLNLYEFCGNNANCYVDFNGLWSHPLWPDKPEVSVTQIPAIMRANGMSVSAKLMERWLTTASSSAMGEDISTVKMDWALSFTRAKTAYDEIFTSQLYATERCKNVIRAKIKALKPAKNIRFCDLSRDVRAVYKDQVTYKVVGSSYRDPIDDMLGALGRFTFQVALSANVKVKPYGYCAIVDEVGVFIRDQYEFSGIQPLGYWNPQTNYVGKNPYRGSLIENGTFQIYRNNTGLGGDFYIYSDVKRTKLEKPIKIRISK